MAEILDINQMLAHTYEPKRQHRWIIAIDGIDAYYAKSTARPSYTVEEVSIRYINTVTYHAGIIEPNTMPLTLNDPIAPSAAQKVMDWIRLCYEFETGRAGYAAFYKKDFKLKLLDGPGAVVEQWSVKGGWLKDIDFGPLDYTTSELANINCTLRYDRALLDF